MKKDVMNIVDRVNLIQLNSPIIIGNKIIKILNNTSTYNTNTNNSGIYLNPFIDDNKLKNQNYKNCNDEINLNISKEDSNNNDNYNENNDNSNMYRFISEQKNNDSFYY